MSRYFHFLIAAIFLVFAAIQYNDPDPLIWILLYAFVAFVALAKAFGKHFPWVIRTGILICIVWVINYLPSITNWIEIGMPSIVKQMKAESPHIELVREFFGLLLCIAVLTYYIFNPSELKRTK